MPAQLTQRTNTKPKKPQKGKRTPSQGARTGAVTKENEIRIKNTTRLTAGTTITLVVERRRVGLPQVHGDDRGGTVTTGIVTTRGGAGRARTTRGAETIPISTPSIATRATTVGGPVGAQRQGVSRTVLNSRAGRGLWLQSGEDSLLECPIIYLHRISITPRITRRGGFTAIA